MAMRFLFCQTAVFVVKLPWAFINWDSFLNFSIMQLDNSLIYLSISILFQQFQRFILVYFMFDLPCTKAICSEEKHARK